MCLSCFQARPLTLVKEPHAFKKVRYNIAKVLASQTLRGVANPAAAASGGGEDGGEGEEEEEEGCGSRSISPITVRELDFLPLDVNAGKFHTGGKDPEFKVAKGVNVSTSFNRAPL